MQTNKLLNKSIIVLVLLSLISVGSAQQADVSEHIQQLNHKDKSVRLYGVYALGVLGDAQAVQPLIKILKDSDLYIRLAAIDALGEIGDSSALPALTELLQDENHIIRAHAANTVAKIAPQQEEEYQTRRYVKDLSALDRMVRSQGFAALASLQPERVTMYRRILALADLADADPSIRVMGAAVLGEVGDSDGVQPLIESLKDPNPLVRSNAAMALGRIALRLGGETVQAAIEPLATTLSDEDHGVRSHASHALVQLGDAAVQPLIAALSMPDGKINPTAVNALGQIGEPAIEALMASLEADDARTRATAAGILSQIQPSKARDYQTLRSLNDLKDPEPSVRILALTRLGEIGHIPEPSVLTAALSDQDARVRQSAATAIGKIGEAAIEALIPVLSDGNPSVRWHAIMAAGLIASKLEANARLQPAIEPLLAALKDSDASIRAIGAETLTKIGTSASKKIAMLLTTENATTRAIAAALLTEIEPDMADAYQRIRYTADLQDEQPTIRVAAAEALGRVGVAETTDALVAALNDENPTVRRNAATALVGLGESAITPLVTALGQENLIVRWHAVVAMGRLAEKVEDTASMQPAVEGLAGLLRDSDSSIRAAAINTLAKIGKPAADALIALLGDNDSSVRSGATRALGQMGDAVTGSLIAVLSNPKSSVRQNAAAALGMIAPDEATQYQGARYINDLKDSDAEVRVSAAKMLGLMGGLRAVEPLITALGDADYRVRLHTTEALGVLGDKRAISALNSVKKDKVKAVSQAAKDAIDQLKRLP